MISVEELYLTRELDQHEVSIKVGNVIPVTYGLVANVIFFMIWHIEIKFLSWDFMKLKGLTMALHI